MFWKKRTYQHPTFGEFTYAHGAWHGSADVPGCEEFMIWVGGDRNQPDHRHLDTAGEILAAISEWKARALAYLQNREDAGKFVEGSGDLILNGVAVKNDGFDLTFDLTERRYAYVEVRFTNGKPTGVRMGD